MWSGPVTSFSAKIEDRAKSFAYVLGSEAYQNGLSMKGPFVRGSEADKDWIDGYLDAMYLEKL